MQVSLFLNGFWSLQVVQPELPDHRTSPNIILAQADHCTQRAVGFQKSVRFTILNAESVIIIQSLINSKNKLYVYVRKHDRKYNQEKS
jgi:hypothetical protein